MWLAHCTARTGALRNARAPGEGGLRARCWHQLCLPIADAEVERAEPAGPSDVMDGRKVGILGDLVETAVIDTDIYIYVYNILP